MWCVLVFSLLACVYAAPQPRPVFPILPPLPPPPPVPVPPFFPLPKKVIFPLPPVPTFPLPPIVPNPPSPPKLTLCEGLVDGKYPSPEEECAQHFYMCRGGEALKMDCSRGTYYDSISGDCLFRQWVQACGGQSTPKPKVTIAPPRNPPFAFDCSEKKDGNYEHPSAACSELYASCFGGEVEFMECPTGLAFDVVSNECLNPAYVPWCPGGVATAKPKPLPPADPTLPPFEFDCWDLVDGDYPHPTISCSGEYVSCVGKEPTYRACGGSLKFDASSKMCLLSAHISACGGTPTPTPKITKSPSLPNNPGIPFECAGRGDGDYAHPTELCSEYYWSCSGGLSEWRFCPTSLKFDSLSGECQEEIYTEGCGGVPTPKPKTPAPTPPQQPPFEFECSNKVDGDYDHPSNPCSQEYVSCSGGVASFKLCPGSLVFDWDTVRCLDSQYVAGCGGQPTPPENPEATSPKPKIDFVCAGLLDGYYADPKEVCSGIFYSCVGGEAEVMSCPGQLAWDLESGDCLNREYVLACGGIPTPKTPSPKGIPTPPANPSPVCIGKVPGMYPTEEGCSQKFMSCNAAEEGEEGVCQQNTWFDQETGQCLWRRNVRSCGGEPYVPNPKTPAPPPSNPPPLPSIPTLPPLPPTLPPLPTLRPLPPKKGVDLSSCLNLPNGIYGTKCTKNFFFCVEGHTEARTCKPTTHFDGVSRCKDTLDLGCF